MARDTSRFAWLEAATMAASTRPHRGPSRQQFVKWMGRYHTPELVSQAEAVAARHDMVTLIAYVRDHAVVGTPSTGNMPRKAIREVTAQFANPPELDVTIGQRMFKLRTEFEVWPLYFLHILAEVGTLLETPKGRRWELTEEAYRFLAADPLMQLVVMNLIWWHRTNWLVAFRLGGLGDFYPKRFGPTTLRLLQALPVGQVRPVEAFADVLIAKGRLKWNPPESEWATDRLRGAVRVTVVDPLGDLGVLERTYDPEWIAAGFPPRTETFSLTPLGVALLAAVKIQG
jgi:hypothetical protein